MGQGIACVKTIRYVMSLGIGKTLYQIGMVFNTGLIPELIPWSTPIYPVLGRFILWWVYDRWYQVQLVGTESKSGLIFRIAFYSSDE
jgi:hypothetical protein